MIAINPSGILYPITAYIMKTPIIPFIEMLAVNNRGGTLFGKTFHGRDQAPPHTRVANINNRLTSEGR